MSIPCLVKKRGFGLTSGFWNRFGVVLIKAPIEAVSSALSKYYRANCHTDIFPVLLDNKNRHCLWQYIGHEWTVWWAFSSEEVAFTLSLFLETKTIVLTHQGTSGWSEFKMFDRDKLVEYYGFGLNDREPEEKLGDLIFGSGYLDIEIVQDCSYSNSTISSSYRHMFVSSSRTITEREMRMSLEAIVGEFGFLDVTFRYYGAYLPDCSETPLDYNRSNLDFHPEQSDFERIEEIVLPPEVFYWRNMLPIPGKVNRE